jgi:hypothetical protein
MLETDKLTKDKFIERLIEKLSETSEGARQLADIFGADIKAHVDGLAERAKGSLAATVVQRSR